MGERLYHTRGTFYYNEYRIAMQPIGEKKIKNRLKNYENFVCRTTMNRTVPKYFLVITPTNSFRQIKICRIEFNPTSQSFLLVQKEKHSSLPKVGFDSGFNRNRPLKQTVGMTRWGCNIREGGCEQRKEDDTRQTLVTCACASLVWGSEKKKTRVS